MKTKNIRTREELEAVWKQITETVAELYEDQLSVDPSERMALHRQLGLRNQQALTIALKQTGRLPDVGNFLDFCAGIGYPDVRIELGRRIKNVSEFHQHLEQNWKRTKANASGVKHDKKS
jgi:hypothetical protein